MFDLHDKANEIYIGHSLPSAILVVGITLRSPASGRLEGERSSPSVLHFKGFKGDGYLKHRARQVQLLVMLHFVDIQVRLLREVRIPLGLF
jgi:hypothetical protein